MGIIKTCGRCHSNFDKDLRWCPQCEPGRPLIYTIGNPAVYEPLFDNPEPPRKLGREANYIGGSVWQTREEAQAYAVREGYCVYGVLADWATGTEVCAHGKWNDLLRTSLLTRLQ